MKRIISLIANTIGLKEDALSQESWQRILKEKGDLSAYYRKLLASPEELQALIEQLVVLESWFFRDKGALDFIVNRVKGSRFTRILSAPCASGEEPYSLVMALLDAGATPNQFRVDGRDVSKVALKRAEKGLYSSHSFRGRRGEWRLRYFDENGQLKKEVQKLVHFSYGNLYKPEFAKQQYDVILCRNLLIYLHPEGQSRVLETCRKLLAPDGILVVAPVEASIAMKFGFAALQGRAFVLKKRERAPPKKIASSHEEFVLKDLLAEARELADRGAYKDLLAEARELADRGAYKDLLAEARELADRGAYKEAEVTCRHYLKERDMDPEGYFLLGAIYHAQGKEEMAEEMFRKTLYLAPNHPVARLLWRKKR